MRHGHGAGFLRVVVEVTLGEVVGLFTDDLDRVLVGADGTICTEAKEHTTDSAFRLDNKVGIYVQAGVGDIIVDAESEMVLGVGVAQLIQRRLDHRRGEFLGRQPIAAADNLDIAPSTFYESVDDIQVERFAERARFLGTVEHGDQLDALRQGFHEVVHRERAIEAYTDRTDFFASGRQILDGLDGGLAA